MKAIMITFDQAHYEAVVDILERSNCRGFTAWPEVSGRGTTTGEPHYGSHAWPSLCCAIYTVVEDSRADIVMDKLRQLDTDRPLLGLRAFMWTIEKCI